MMLAPAPMSKPLTDDPAFIYQDTLVAVDRERGINIGQPSAHALWLDALALREGETVLQNRGRKWILHGDNRPPSGCSLPKTTACHVDQ